ncbi:MAG TPA: TauD/TfdA family dioxygenase [Stellaceae bacterium]|nr:TauD/TfdA family dioxygenase [Stellaceae bacterium]
MEGLSAPLTVTKLAPAIGAEVAGVDLGRPLDAPTVATLRRAWHDHAVLLVRGQSLSEADQVRYGEYFGVLGTALSESRLVPAHPSVMFVSNIRQDGKLIGRLPDGEMFFHSDQCYLAAPPAGTMLYGIELPSSGGNTLFASAYAAYDALPAAMKARLEGLQALNAYDLKNSATRRGAIPPDAPRHVHPVVRTHPATGRKALYVNRLMTQHIVGMDTAASEALLAELFDHQEQRPFVYEHVWRVGDVILWDNRCALHARTDFDPGERRLLRRITVLAEPAD